MAAALGAAAVAALLAGTLVGLSRMTSAPASASAASGACERAVFEDWSDNGRIDATYPLSCYRRAIAGLPSDVRDYSDAPTEIERALAVASNRSRGASPPGTPGDEPGVPPPLVLVALGVAGVLGALAAAAALLGRRSVTRRRRRPAS